jgi:hypothetical protein
MAKTGKPNINSSWRTSRSEAMTHRVASSPHRAHSGLSAMWRAALRVGVALTLLSLSIASGSRAFAYTSKEAHEIFDLLDQNHDGKITRLEFESYKFDAFYFRWMPTRTSEMRPLTLEETGLSREFFMKADANHDGLLDGVEMADVIHFDDLATNERPYFTFDDLVVELNKIGR